MWVRICVFVPSSLRESLIGVVVLISIDDVTGCGGFTDLKPAGLDEATWDPGGFQVPPTNGAGSLDLSFLVPSDDEVLNWREWLSYPLTVGFTPLTLILVLWCGCLVGGRSREILFSLLLGSLESWYDWLDGKRVKSE